MGLVLGHLQVSYPRKPVRWTDRKQQTEKTDLRIM